MSIAITNEEPQILWVRLESRLDTLGVGEFDSEFQALLSRDSKNTVVDLSRVSFIGSVGIRMLVTAGKALGTQDHKLILLKPQKLVASTLRAMAVDQILPIAESDETARDLLGL